MQDDSCRHTVLFGQLIDLFIVHHRVRYFRPQASRRSQELSGKRPVALLAFGVALGDERVSLRINRFGQRPAEKKGAYISGLFRDASSWRSRNAQPSPVGYQTNDGTVALAVCGRTVDCRRSGRAHYTAQQPDSRVRA